MAAKGRHVIAHRCACGGIFLHQHESCPSCGRRPAPVRVSAEATLLSHTTVRVNPTGQPFRLGVARVAVGATTLCIVEGVVRGNGRDRVTLVVRDGRYVALGALARIERGLSGRNRRTASSRED